VSDTQSLLLQRLEWTVLKRLDGQLQGDYRSLFRGAGIVFADLREYQISDDVRHIDWSVTARMQVPFVKVHHEDREISAWFVIDVSPSMNFTSCQRSKRELAIETVAVLASLLAKRGNRVGALIFSAKGESADIVVPSGQGRRHVLQLLHHLSAVAERMGQRTQHKESGTQLHHLLDQAAALIKRRSCVFVVSDFLSESTAWTDKLGQLARRHDVLAIQIGDRAERELPDMGTLVLQDAETGEQILLDGSDAGFRKRFAQAAKQRQTSISQAISHAGCGHLSLLTDEALDAQLIEFARRRKSQSQMSRPNVSTAAVLDTSHA
jgi:uncharacterized protein (DUF58 family)